MPEIMVRQARYEDYKKILDIQHNIFDGADYFPSVFHKYIADPCIYPVLAETDGEVVRNIHKY